MRGGETEKRGKYLIHAFKHVVLEMLSITYSSAKGSHSLCHISLYTRHSLSMLTKQKCLSYIITRLRKQFHSGFRNQLLGNKVWWSNNHVCHGHCIKTVFSAFNFGPSLSEIAKMSLCLEVLPHVLFLKVLLC